MKQHQETHSRHPRRALALGIAITLSLVFGGTSAMAQTAVGTVISNTVNVTWTGGSASDTATFTVALKTTAPDLAFVSSSPADLTNNVGEAQAVTLNYRLTSQANGADGYTLAVASTNTGVTAPGAGPTINGGTTTVDLGASMALQDVTNSTVITIPGMAADHGLAAGDKITIGSTDYTIASVNADPDGDSTPGPNTALTISANVTIAAGTNIYEYVTFTTTLTTGTLTASPTAGTHAVKSDAYVTGEAAKIDSDTRTITVRPATLTVDKTVTTDGTPQPGETVSYSILVTNTGAAAAANVVIVDPIPAFTVFAANVVNGGCTVAYSEDNQGSWIAAPTSNPAVTDIRFSCGSLAGSGTITVGFDVTIE